MLRMIDGWSGRPKDASTDENVKVVHTLFCVIGGETSEAYLAKWA